MKNILAALLISSAAFSQNHTIQIELVDNEVGYVNNLSDLTSCGTNSNDSGLNAIFSTHNVGNYCSAAFTSYPEIVSVGGGLIDCYGCDPNLLIADLEAYNTVIGRARRTPGPEIFANHIFIKLNETTTQTGTTGANVAITSNPALNAIFETNTVFWFDNIISDWYELKCDCYSPDLILNLLDEGIILQNSVDPLTQEVIYDNYSYEHIVYLSNQDFASNQLQAYPNPFQHDFQISPNLMNASYSLVDITGKNIARDASFETIKAAANGLDSGVYFLKVVSEGNVKTIRLVKQ